MSREVVAIIDFGSQYGQLIARRVREHNVYSQIYQPDVKAEKLAQLGVKGIILSGGPASVYSENAPTCDEKIFDLGVPILGICYGMQVGCKILGANISPAENREYGRTNLRITDNTDLFLHLPQETTVWMSHGDLVNELSEQFEAIATTDSCPYAAVRNKDRKFYGVQFHPEVTHTPKGKVILENFLYDICNCSGDWQMSDFVAQTVAAVQEQVGDAAVICGLSGGVDSAVTAALLYKAIGDRLVCIFVDNGLLRMN